MSDAPALGHSVYLAGSITGLTYGQALGWRRDAVHRLTELGYDVYSPMRHKLHLASAFHTETIPHTSPMFNNPFHRDLHDIDRSDYVLCFDPYARTFGRSSPSVGTLVELGYAYASDKYVILVDPAVAYERDASYNLHPFVSGVARDVLPSLEDAYQLLAEYRPSVPGGPIV